MRRAHLTTCLVLVVGCTSLLDVDGFEYDTDPGAGGTVAGSGGSGGMSDGAGATGVGGGTGGVPNGAGGSGATGGSGGATGGSGGATSSTFFDNFDRDDDPDIGNGWLEKTPGTFGLASDHIIKLQDGPGFNDNVVYRPQAEALLDVEASVEFELTTTTTDRPQLFVRGQYDSITTAGGYISYKIWLNGSANEATLARQQIGGGSSQLGGMDLSPGLTPGERYRIRMRVTGTDPVQLHGWVEVDNGGWTIIDETIQTDNDAARIITPGVAGFAGSSGTAYFLEDYRFTGL